jgi:hypothetical protein
MAKVRSDRVKEATFVTGTSDVELLGSGTGFQTFSVVCDDGDTFDYAITHTGTSEWETGVGTYDADTNSIVRTKIVAGSEGNQDSASNAPSPTNFSAGTKQVFITVNSDSFEIFDRTADDLAALALALS